jgi:hypothetical protein
MKKPLMTPFIGVKEIKASSEMTLKEYNNYRGWDMPKDEDGDKLVYLVEYAVDKNSTPNHPNHEGYISMSPKHVFDEAYRRTDGMTFGLAIEAMKKGSCVARKGWNGNNMFVCKQVPSVIDSGIIPKMQSLPQSAKDTLLNISSEPIRYSNQMIIVKNNPTGDRVIDSWVASSSDTFAEDWLIIE